MDKRRTIVATHDIHEVAYRHNGHIIVEFYSIPLVKLAILFVFLRSEMRSLTCTSFTILIDYE